MTEHDLSPETRRYLETLAEWTTGSPLQERSADDLRKLTRDLLVDLRGPMAEVAAVREIEARGVRARLFEPRPEPAGGILVWLHGGGWIVGDLESHEHIARMLAHSGQYPVLLVDYRLAPEHPYPAASDDAWEAFQWASSEFDAVVIGGDSAGGCLAAGTALRARDHNLPLARQILVYPTLEYRSDSDSHREFERIYANFGPDNLGTNAREGVRRAWDLYVPDAAQRELSDAAPLKAASLAGLAPATIILAEHDILRPEGEEYAARLQAAGVDTDLITYRGQVHGFLDHPALLADARDALNRIATSAASALRFGH